MRSWANPDEAEVARTLSAVGEPTLRRLFFQELENPAWLAPLTKFGAFADPGIVDSNDGYRAWPWPEGDYLLRIAAERPAEVTALAQKLTDSRNPWVQRTLIDIAAVLPVEHLMQLVTGVAKLIQGGPDRVDVAKVATLIERLLDNEKRNEARRLLVAMFSPVAGDEEEMAFGSRRRISSSIDDYWYKELLARLEPRVVGLGLEGLKLVAGWLIRAIEIRSGGRSEDSYSIWRPSIGPHGQNTGLYEIDDALIDTVRGVGFAVSRAAGTREAIDFLNSRKQFLLRRIGVEVAASAVDDGNDAVLAAGCEMLLDQTLLALDARPEYAHLARALVPRLSEQKLEEWGQFLLGGTWLPSEDRLRRLAAWPEGDADAVSSDQVERERRRLTHRLLSAFSTVLTGEIAEEFAALEAQLGEVPHPEFASYMESFTGPTSPLSTEELAAMTTRDAADYLAGWTSEASHHFGPSVDGLARVLEGVVAADPARFEEIHSEFLDLKPAYVRAVVSGWAQAAKVDYRPSAAVWQTLGRLATHEFNEHIPDENISLDDDPRWQWVHRALADLANAVVDSSDSGMDQLGAAWQILKPLTGHFDPTPDHEERYGGSNMDPLTLSLNTVRPVALRGAIHLLSALTEEGSEEAIARRSDVLAQLAIHASPTRDPSLAVAAVFGEGIGRIWNIDQNWVGDRLGDLLLAVTSADAAKRVWADVVVSVALRVYRPSPAVLGMMRPALEAVFSPQYAAHEHTEGWREHRSAVQSAASHVIWTITLGSIQLDDPLVIAMFSGVVDVDALSESLGHLGWQLMHLVSNENQHGPSAEFLESARGLIESRLSAARDESGQFDELSHFHWWIKSGAFDIEWWLPILAEITETGVSMDKTFIGESLEQAARRDPLTTITVFERLVGQTDYWQRYDLLQHAAKIIAAAIESGVREAVRRARSLMDMFAREGHVDIIDQIERFTHPEKP
jgi:hypothetical protein